MSVQPSPSTGRDVAPRFRCRRQPRRMLAALAVTWCLATVVASVVADRPAIRFPFRDAAAAAYGRQTSPVVLAVGSSRTEGYFEVSQMTARLADAITKDVMDVLHYGEESVSVAFEEITPQDWAERVYEPDIVNSPEKLYKKPGYTM